MKIAIIGANGQLGSDIVTVLKQEQHEVIEFNHDNFDITDFEKVNAQLAALKLDVLINPAAFHHVDQCEADPAKAFLVNAVAAENLAKQCKEHNSLFIHISTDYVFDGLKNEPYVESDTPSPLNNYGVSKLAGELMIKNTGARHIIVRTSGLYGLNPCRAKGGKNFVELMLSLAQQGKPIRVVNSERVSPTFTVDLARQISKLLTVDQSGICHATAQGSCSWYEFVQKVFELEGIIANLSIAEPGEFVNKVKRPTYSVLENKFLAANNIDCMRPWYVAVEDYLRLRKS